MIDHLLFNLGWDRSHVRISIYLFHFWTISLRHSLTFFYFFLFFFCFTWPFRCHPFSNVCEFKQQQLLHRLLLLFRRLFHIILLFLSILISSHFGSIRFNHKLFVLFFLFFFYWPLVCLLVITTSLFVFDSGLQLINPNRNASFFFFCFLAKQS